MRWYTSRLRFGGVFASRGMPAVLLAMVILRTPTPVSAAPLIVSFSPSISSTPAGGTGSFDVDLTNTALTSDDVAAFSLGLKVAAASGVTFTAVDTNTAAPYIFGSLQSSPFSFDTFPNTQFTASDASLTSPFLTTVTSATSFGLAHVSYAVAPGTPSGLIPIELVFDATSFSDPAGAPIDFVGLRGDIDVTGPAAIPEPSTMVLALTSMFFGLTWLARRRRAF